MTQFVFGNFFQTEILETISPNATTILVAPSASRELPKILLGEDKEARLTLWDGVNPPEIVACTRNEWTGTLTVVRAKEGTTDRSWASGTQITCSLTAEIINAALQAFFDFEEVLNASFLPLAGGTLTGPLVLSGNPLQPLSAATKAYVDGTLGDKLPLGGGTMDGDINMDGNRVVSLPTPIVDSEPATKGYTDSAITALTLILADRSGVLSSTGTTSAFIVAPNATYSALVDGLTFTYKPHGTNAAGATMDFGGFGAKAINYRGGQAVPDGLMLGGLPVSLTYVAASNAWFLREQKVNDFDFTAGDLKHSARTTDHDRWLLADGRAVTRTGPTAGLFGVISTVFGIGDNSTTYNIPDARGRVLVGKDNMGGVSANRSVTAIAGGTLGAVGGQDVIALTLAQLPVYTPAGTNVAASQGGTIAVTGAIIAGGNNLAVSLVEGGGHTHGISYNNVQGFGGGGSFGPAAGTSGLQNVNASINVATTGMTAAINSNTIVADLSWGVSTQTFTPSSHNHAFNGTSVGTGATHSTTQPSIIVNVFVRF